MFLYNSMKRKLHSSLVHFSRATRSVLNARDTYGIVLSFGRCSFLFKAVRCHEWHVSEGAVARDTRRMPLRLDRHQWCSIGDRERKSNRCGAQEKETRGYLFAFILIRHYLESESLAERNQRDQLQRHSSYRTTHCCFDRHFYLESAQLITDCFSIYFTKRYHSDLWDIYCFFL